MMKTLMAATAVMLPCSACMALESGRDLLPYCKRALEVDKYYPHPDPDPDLYLAGICVGIVEGVSWSTQRIRQSLCMDIPSSVSRMQKLRIVMAYMERRPELLHINFDGLVGLALSEAWPCKREESK
jgi:hypothetical protein